MAGNQASVYDYDDDEELDLIKLVSTNANDSNQYLVFEGSNGELYAKNVSKIEELLVYKDLSIARNSNDGYIIGTSNIRGKMTTIMNFDEWFGNEVLPDNEYELVILATYGGHRLGIIVKRVEYIVNIPPKTMTDNSDNDEKTTFITKIQIAQKEKMCLIFDSDRLLPDVFKTTDTQAIEDTNSAKESSSNKIVLFADDSRFIRGMVEDLFKKMKIKYRMYPNGQLLLDDLKNLNPEDIALFITDLEMPVMGGRELVAKIRSNSEYDNINIIVHTNMSNNNMGDSLSNNGAQSVIGKVDMLALSEAIKKLIV